MAKNRSIGSLVLAALLGCSDSGGDHGHEYPPPPIPARWMNVFRMPDLRAVRFANPDQGIVAGLATAIFRTDNGTSATPTWWQQEHVPFARGGDILAMDSFPNTSEFHAVGSDAAGGRWWTTDNAAEWVTPDVTSTPPAFTAVDQIAPGQAYYLRSDGTIRLIQGTTVTNLSVGLAGTWNAIDFAGTTGRGYAGGSGGLIRKSLDGGATWATQPLPGAVGTPDLRDFSILQPTMVYACGGGVVVKTTDGTNWLDARGNLPGGLNLRGIHFPFDETTGWVVGDGGAIYKTADNGATWTQQGAVLGVTANLYDVWFVGTLVGYAVGDAGTILRTTDGGATWVNLTRGTLDDFNAVDFTQDGARGIAVGNGGKAFRTLDGGATWSALTLGTVADLYGVSIFSATGEVAWICGAAGTLLKTSNLGTAATFAPPAQSFGAVALRAVHLPSTSNEFMAYVVGDGGALFKSLDGGMGAASWTQQTLPGTLGSPNFRTISSTLSGIVLTAAGSDGKVAYTDMAGAIWYDLTVPGLTGVTLNSIQSPTASDLFAAASDGTLRRCFLVSGTPPIPAWSSSSPGFTANAIAFPSTSNGWGVDGGIRYTEDGGTTVPWTVSPDHVPPGVTLRGLWMSQNTPGLGFAVGTGGTILKTTVGGK